MRHQASSQAKKPALSGTAEHGLRFYALAATAASVSVLALAQPAEGEIIITNKTIPIHANKGVLLDLNGDGVNDFTFFFSNYSIGQYSVNHLSMQPLGTVRPPNAVIGRSYMASALLRGAKIGPGGRFIRTYVDYGIPIEQSTLCTQNCGEKSGYSFDQLLEGKWAGGHPNRFIGVKFKHKRRDPLWMDTYDGDGKAQGDWPWPDRIVLRDDHGIRLRVGGKQVV